jgi:signal transduction histidine kinase
LLHPKPLTPFSERTICNIETALPFGSFNCMNAWCRWWLLLLVISPLVCAETSPPDPDLPDGDQDLAVAQSAYAAATDEPSALRALSTIVNLHRRRGDYTEGLAGADEGLARARAIRDVALQVEFLYLQGRIYWNLTDYPRSLEIHLEELVLARQLGDPFLLARTHGGLGLTYQRYERDEDALHHFHLGLTEAARATDNRMRGSLLNSLGNYHLTRGELERAVELYEEALTIRVASGNSRAIAETLTNLGLAADARGDHLSALDYLRRALVTFEALKYRRYIANTHRRMGRVLRNAGRMEDSLANIAAAERYAATLESDDVLADILYELALTQEAKGDLNAALATQRRHATLREQLRNAEDRRRMSELRARYGAEQKELEIQLLRQEQALLAAEQSRRRSRQIALISSLGGGITLLAALSFFQLLRLRGERRLRRATEDARRRAETAEQVKSQLLRMASHDLKVPLQALHATAGFIADQSEDASGVRRRARDMQSDTARMQTLVRDFLEISAVEQGHLHLHPTRVDLPAIACETAAVLRPLALRRQQQLTAHPPAGVLPHVRADAPRLRQVFENLIGNALKYTQDGGEISVLFGMQGPWVFAEVRDNGPGLKAADFARIFDPSLSSTSAEGSNGLGLMIVRELLNLQGGRLEVQSQPGQGAVFRVLFPVA